MDSKDFIGCGDGIWTTWPSGYENIWLVSARPAMARACGINEDILTDEMPPKNLRQHCSNNHLRTKKVPRLWIIIGIPFYNVYVCALTQTARQNQIRECEQDIQFCSLFSQPSVSCFLKAKLLLYNCKDMFHFGSDRRFFALSALDLCSGSIGAVLSLGWTMIDLSGIWLLDSTPQKSKKARLSITSTTVATSERLYRFWIM